MATEQESIKVYVDADLAAEVKRLVREEGRTITGLVRVLLRRYVAEAKEEAAA